MDAILIILYPASYLLVIVAFFSVVASPLAGVATAVIATRKDHHVLKYSVVGTLLFASGIWPWVLMVLRFSNRNHARCLNVPIYLTLYWLWASLIVFLMGVMGYFIGESGSASLDIRLSMNDLILYSVQFLCTLALIVSLLQMLYMQDYYQSGLANRLGVQSLHDEGIVPPIYLVIPFSMCTMWTLAWMFFIVYRDEPFLPYPWIHYATLIICMTLTLAWLVFLAYSWFARRSASETDDL